MFSNSIYIIFILTKSSILSYMIIHVNFPSLIDPHDITHRTYSVTHRTYSSGDHAAFHDDSETDEVAGESGSGVSQVDSMKL